MRIQKEYPEKEIIKLFNRGCTRFNLLEDGDKILIALSGGKDSLELVRLLAMRSRIHKPSINVEAAHVLMDNIPYETDRSYISGFCEEQGIKLHILHTRFEEDETARKTHCFLCSWHRRKALLEFARDNGFNKVALGHHMDDIVTTFLMNITFEGSRNTMTPKLQQTHYPVQIIRPLCMVHERLISDAARQFGFERQKTPCPYEHDTQRKSMTDVLRALESLNPEARYSLWKAMGLEQ